MGNVSDFNAIKKWNAIPDDFRKKILQNVFCRNCGVTAMQSDYSITYDKKVGILLNGTCVKCGNKVCRVVEDL
jgi:ribosomal protein S27AE